MEIKTPDQVRAEFKAAGTTFGQWARENGYRPAQVYRVTSGVDKGYYGDAHEIAVKLGLKAKEGEEVTEKPSEPKMITPIKESKKPKTKGPAIVRTVELEVRHTRCRHGKPLVVVNGLPGEFDVELRPEQLRSLAAVLLKVADACGPMDEFVPDLYEVYREYRED